MKTRHHDNCFCQSSVSGIRVWHICTCFKVWHTCMFKLDVVSTNTNCAKTAKLTTFFSSFPYNESAIQHTSLSLHEDAHILLWYLLKSLPYKPDQRLIWCKNDVLTHSVKNNKISLKHVHQEHCKLNFTMYKVRPMGSSIA